MIAHKACVMVGLHKLAKALDKTICYLVRRHYQQKGHNSSFASQSEPVDAILR